jgi:hypothetical protein
MPFDPNHVVSRVSFLPSFESITSLKDNIPLTLRNLISVLPPGLQVSPQGLYTYPLNQEENPAREAREGITSTPIL